MPGVTGDAHLGQDREIRIAQEDSDGFNAEPAAPSWNAIPLLDDGWAVGGSRNVYTPDTNLAPGANASKIAIPHGFTPDGSMTTMPFPEILAFLLEMGLGRDADGDVYSYWAEFYSPVEGRTFGGLVVDTLTIEVTGTGDADVQLSYDFLGASESKDDTISGSFDYSSLTLVPFMFRDATLYEMGSEVTDIEEFTITIENNVIDGPFVGDERSYLWGAPRDISLELTKLNSHDNYREAVRSGNELTFRSTFTHPDGHIWDMQLPRLYVPEQEETGAPSEPIKESPTLDAYYDEGHDADIVYGVDLTPTTTVLPAVSTTTSW